MSRRTTAWLGTAILAVQLASGSTAAQAQDAPTNAREAALIDLAGQWVAVVNEDWRWRMVTPPVGDVASVPLNAEGRRLANAWDLDADRANDALCRAFGPPGLIRQPGRVRIDWEDDDTLALEFDAGMQTRRFHFAAVEAPGTPSLQGHSQAEWVRQRRTRGFFGLVGQDPTPGGALEVRTTRLEHGYLRPNGVPYSDQATVLEYFDTFTLDDAGTWLIVTTVVNDPVYLSQEFVISTQFRKDDDPSGWTPRPCAIPAPRPQS
jgi:hypothetical protein